MALPKELTTVTPLSKALAMIFFILFPFLGFYGGMQYQEFIDMQNIQTVNTNPSSINHPTPSENSMENWKTYINGDGRFSLTMPKDIINKTINDVSVFTNPDAENLRYTENLLEFYIEIMQNPSRLSPQDYIDKKYSDVPDNQGRGSDFINSVNKSIRDSKKDIVINNIPAVTTSHTGFEQIGKAVWIQNDDKIILIRLGGGETGMEPTKKAEETFDQILSTFKFLDPTENSDIINDLSLEMNKTNIPGFKITVSKVVGNYATGGAGVPPSGSVWFAVKENGKWKEVWHGQNTISCDPVNKYNIPIEIYEECTNDY